METEDLNSASPTTNYKLLVLGAGPVGKTSIATKFAFGIFDNRYIDNIGLDFPRKTFHLGGRNVSLHILDEMISWEDGESYLIYGIRDSSAVIIAIDVTNRQTLNRAHGFIEEVNLCGRTDIIIILVGNKVDKVKERCVTSEEAAAKAREWGAYYMEVSAKTGLNIKTLFTVVAWELAARENLKLKLV